MSKKLAAGSDKIVLDVTTGSGAFMKNTRDAKKLAKHMVAIGNHAGKETVAILTGMEEPLGFAIGNNMEVKEAIEVLKGDGPEDVKEVSVALAGMMPVSYTHLGMASMVGNWMPMNGRRRLMGKNSITARTFRRRFLGLRCV